MRGRHAVTLFSLVLEELVEEAGYHTVVKLFHLVGALAVKTLEALVRGDDINLPGGKRSEMYTDLAI